MDSKKESSGYVLVIIRSIPVDPSSDIITMQINTDTTAAELIRFIEFYNKGSAFVTRADIVKLQTTVI